MNTLIDENTNWLKCIIKFYLSTYGASETMKHGGRDRP